MSWSVLNKSYPDILRSTNQQTNAALLWQPPGYEHITVSRETGATSKFTSQEGIAIRRFELHNRSGGVASCGIGFRLQNRFWKAGQFTSGGVYTDDTADAQSTTTNDVVLTSVTNGGFVVVAAIPFDWFSVNITTAEVDAGGATVPDHSVLYSNSAGTGWTALGVNAAFTDGFTLVNTVYTAAVHEFVWQKPADWGAIVAIDTLPVGWYAIQVNTAHAEAGDTVALAKAIEVGTMIVVEAVADNGLYANDWTTFHEERADGLVAYFSTANAGNRVYAEVTSQ